MFFCWGKREVTASVFFKRVPLLAAPSPSQSSRFARCQLSQRESLWQSTQTSSLCQGLSLWERWICEAKTERARTLAGEFPRQELNSLSQSLRLCQLPLGGSLWRTRKLCTLAGNCIIMPKAPSQRGLASRSDDWGSSGKNPFRLLPLVAATFPKGTAEPSQSKPDGFASSPEGGAFCHLLVSAY